MNPAAEIIEAEATEVSRAIAVREPVDVATWTPSFVQTIDQAVEQVRARDEFMHRVMRKDLDYGVIPGTGTKPTLLKPGAERLLSAYGLHPQIVDKVAPTLDYIGHDHAGEPFFEFRKTCRVWRQTGPSEFDRMLVAEASGSCNSWETKYRYRDSKRICPACSQATIIKGKAEYGGGWVCFKKTGGCGEKYTDSDERITSQPVGRVPNEAVADVVNTVEKMAEKRALVAATIIATGWSDLVTQDVEDAHGNVPPAEAPQEMHGDAPGGPKTGIGSPCKRCADAGLTSTTGAPPTFRKSKRGDIQCNGRTKDLNDQGERGWSNHPMPLAEGEEIDDNRPIPF